MKHYFDDCITLEDVKARYRMLAKKLHPDCGGDEEAFKAMSTEYVQAFERCKHIHKTQEGKTYQQETTETPEEFKDMIDKLLKMEGVKVEIIGSWIWVTGNTMFYKDRIKAMRFLWGKSKQAWYWNGTGKRSTNRGRYSMDGLRNKWGSQVVGTGHEERHATLGS